MKVRALKKFNDLQSKKLRKIGEEFEVTAEKVEEINSTSHGLLVEVIEEDKVDIVKEAEPLVKKKPIKKKVGE